MTYKEVKKMVSECGLNITSEFHEECMEKVLSALEKQIPKKPTSRFIERENVRVSYGQWDKVTTVYSCPNCNEVVGFYYNYCGKCGQRIAYGEENE